MAKYTTKYGLPQSMVDYLNQPLPDISGIFSLPAATTTTTPTTTVTTTTAVDPTDIITKAELDLLYGGGGGGGGDNDGFTNIPDTTNNAGITSIPTFTNFLQNIPTPLNLARKAIENIQNPYTNVFGNLNKETEEAIAREAVSDLQNRIDAGEFGSTTPTLQDDRRTSQYDDPYGPGQIDVVDDVVDVQAVQDAIAAARREEAAEKSRQEAAAQAARESAIAQEAANREAAREAAAAAAAAQAAANREAAIGGGGGGGGSPVGGTGSAAAADTSQGQTGYGSCFIAGTKITMADGAIKNIEDIKVGDIIKGHEGNNEVIKLDPTLLGERKLYSFNDNEHYFFTSEHPFMTEEGWKSIKPEKTKERDGIELYNQLKGELKIGDKLITEKGLIEIKEIKSKEINDPKMPLYNFNVSNDNSYIADGYVVHNKGGGGDGCFLKGTLVTMSDGSKKEIQEIDLGDEVAIGGKVFATGKFLVNNLHDYKGIKVSGSHMVNENNKWVRVEDSEHGKLLGDEEHTVYVFGAENRRILINDILFTDYFEVNEQDKLINNEKNFFNNWKIYAKQDSGNNVDIINAN